MFLYSVGLIYSKSSTGYEACIFKGTLNACRSVYVTDPALALIGTVLLKCDNLVCSIVSQFAKFVFNINVTDKSTSTEGIRTTDPQFECPSALPTELKGNSH